MKKKRTERERRFLFGAVLVAVGVVFLVNVNRGVGAGLMGVGLVFMLSGRKK